MIANLYIATFLLALGGCSAALFGLIKDNSNFDIDKFEYKGDPLGVSCVYDEKQTGFHQETFSGTTYIPTNLAESLNNGRPISIYFDGIASHLKPNGSTFNFAKEWYTASGSNICYITYALEKIPHGIVQVFSHARYMVKTRRLQFTAKLARDLVLSVLDQCYQNETPGCVKSMSQVTMLGFSFGAHIASQACRNLYKSTGEKVGKLIGVDPAGIALSLKRFDQAFISSGDAAYVQIIHTDPMAGTNFQTGDIDIIVDAPVKFDRKHHFSVYMHMATSMKKLLLIAEENGDGRVIPLDSDSGIPLEQRIPRANEVFIGVYSELEESKRGKTYKISFENFRTEIVRRSIAHVVKAQM